jgi:beta-phosphoglucomutase-like phosphatase (HAD superfamily)
MPLGLIVFDCDGVLIDSELLSVQADVECLAACGIDLAAASRHQQRLAALFEADLRPIPGVDRTLDSLPCRGCVASSGTPERLRHALSLVGLFDRFDPDIFSTAMVARGKPAPDLCPATRHSSPQQARDWWWATWQSSGRR